MVQQITKNVDFMPPVTFKDQVVLTFSSCILMLPGFYAFRIGQNIHGIFSILAAVVSFLFWFSPTKVKHNMDLFISRALFIFYLLTGIYCAHGWDQFQVIAAIPLTPLMVGCYVVSNINHYKNSPNWIVFHFLFHIFGTLAQMNTLSAIDTCSRNPFWNSYI